MNYDKLNYAALIFGAVVLLWTFYSALQSNVPLERTAANQQYYAQPTQLVPSQCGDINDPKNLQHLSHHPDQFQDCYKVVDPAKFKQAVGRDLNEFVR